MHRSLDVGRFLIRVTGDAKRRRSGCDQLDACDVFIDPDLMTTQAACGHCRVNGLTFCFIFMAFKALGCISIFIQRDGMNRGSGAHH
jgi:hypothetical protein